MGAYAEFRVCLDISDVVNVLISTAVDGDGILQLVSVGIVLKLFGTVEKLVPNGLSGQPHAVFHVRVS